MTPLAQSIFVILTWGLMATLVMTSMLYISQNIGWSRLNLPFLLGSFFAAGRREANVLGFLLYLAGGELFAFLYYLLFSVIGQAGWVIGTAAGLVHAVLLLTLALPLLPYIHPRVASEYAGPDQTKTLEPPGFLGLHYGYRTPVFTVIGQTAYGVVLGIGFARLLE